MDGTWNGHPTTPPFIMSSVAKRWQRDAQFRSAAIIDSQSVKSSEKGGPHRNPHGYDGGQEDQGKKRHHFLVDTLGLLPPWSDVCPLFEDACSPRRRISMTAIRPTRPGQKFCRISTLKSSKALRSGFQSGISWLLPKRLDRRALPIAWLQSAARRPLPSIGKSQSNGACLLRLRLKSASCSENSAVHPKSPDETLSSPFLPLRRSLLLLDFRRLSFATAQVGPP